MLDPFQNSMPEPNTGCWLWLGDLSRDGYARHNGRMVTRILWRQIHKHLPNDWQVDHKCCVRSCVNPNHLEAVTAQENIYRIHERKGVKVCRDPDTCMYGHSMLDPKNVLKRSDAGTVRCRTCRNEGSNRRQKERRDRDPEYKAASYDANKRWRQRVNQDPVKLEKRRKYHREYMRARRAKERSDV